jgi:hypothetical protein
VKHKCILLSFLIILLISQKLSAPASIELFSGYNIPFGKWSDTFGKGFYYGGTASFTFSEYINPGIGIQLVFPKTGNVALAEYKRVHDTEYISLFTNTGYIFIENRVDISLSKNNTLSVEVGYGLHTQRVHATIIYESYECMDNFSGNGPFVGLGFKRKIDFSVFNYIKPNLRLYYSPNDANYLVINDNSEVEKLKVAEKRVGIFLGIVLTSIGEE